MTVSKKSEKYRVLIDVDGVLRDFVAGLKMIYQREYPEHEVGFVDSRKLEDFFPIGEAIYPFMNDQFAEDILVNAPAIPEAIDSLHKWEDQFEIVIATAQPPEGRYPTFRWLGEHRVPASEIHISHHKSRLDGIALLDDALENLIPFEKSGRIAVCLDQPWNKSWNGPRVKSVEEFFIYLQVRLDTPDIYDDILLA